MFVNKSGKEKFFVSTRETDTSIRTSIKIEAFLILHGQSIFTVLESWVIEVCVFLQFSYAGWQKMLSAI